jgi:thiamine-monophosphate kinase
VSAAVPKDLSRKELRDLSCALEKSAAEWGVEIIGGDTVASDRLGLSITILAKSKRPLYRRVRPGMVVGHTGELGRVGRDLRRLLRGGRVSRRSKFFEPKPRKAFMRRCARLLFGAMDISDGLFDDMAKLAEKNRVGYRFLRRVPKRVGCSGEEYEILFAIDPRRLEALRRRARIARTPVTIVAKAVRGRYKNPCKPHHF